jgi:LPS export ABC transporter protein LptC
MLNRAIRLPGLFLLLLPVFAFFISACENDLNKVKEIASNQVDTVVERTTGVDLIMSDSNKVQIHVTAPLLLQYRTKKPYKLMPHGVKVIYYEKGSFKESANIIADTGIYRETEKLFEFHKNVVITNAKGETYKSDEFYWDQVTKKIYSRKAVFITMEGGNVMNGVGFESDDKFLHPALDKSTGIFHVDEKATQ